MRKSFLFILLLASMTARAVDAAGPAQSVEQRRDELAKSQEMLNDPDPLARLAKMEGMIASGDATATYVAMRTAFASDDPAMRNLAMRTWVASLKRLTLDVMLPADLQKQVDQTMLDPKKSEELLANNDWLKAWASRGFKLALGFGEIDISKNTGKVYSLPLGTLQTAPEFTISGTTLMFVIDVAFSDRRCCQSCSLSLAPAPNLLLQGSVSCLFGRPSPRLVVTAPML